MVLAAATLGRPAVADEVSFAGKTVRMIVGSNAGGVTDVGARVVARFMGKYLPDSPSIVIQNVPGANGIAAANMFYLRSAPDGMTSLAGSSSQVTPDVVRANPSVQYDLQKFKWIGGVYNAGTLVVTTKDGAAQLGSKDATPLAMGQVGGARTEALVVVWASEYLGWKVRFITGYAGNQEISMALRKGELDMLNTSSIVGLQEILTTSDKFVPVMQTGVYKNGKLARRDGFETIPLISEAIEGKISGPAKSAFNSWLDSIQIGKYFAMPPNAPENYVEAYRKAYLKMNEDPEFRKQAVMALEPDYILMTAQEVAVLIDRMAAAHEDDYRYVDHLRDKYGLSGREGASASAKK
jgi:tripartite-type tricarboxylate transporter receptor subunit TctC